MTKGHSVWKGNLNVRRKSYLLRRTGRKKDKRIPATFEKEQENYVSLFRIFETCGMTRKRNIDGKDVVFICFADFEIKVHESRHGGQHARGEANMITKNRYGVADEVDADLVNSMSNGLKPLYPPPGMSLKDWNKN